jgi:hypothetical protein
MGTAVRQLECSCGAVLQADSDAHLLGVVERHIEFCHPDLLRTTSARAADYPGPQLPPHFQPETPHFQPEKE